MQTLPEGATSARMKGRATTTNWAAYAQRGCVRRQLEEEAWYLENRGFGERSRYWRVYRGRDWWQL